MTNIRPVISAVVLAAVAGIICFQMKPVITECSNTDDNISTTFAATNTFSETSYIGTEPITTAVISNAPVTEITSAADTSELTAFAEITITELPVTEETVQGVINGEILYDTEYVEYQLPENPNYMGFKSYEPYYLITAQSVQLSLQQDSVTDSSGFRLLDGRYLVAVGTFCNAPCGTYIDLILENSVLIPCIVGDIKSDAHTDETHAYTKATMCASEFIIDDRICPAAWAGDVSTLYEEWGAKVQKIRVYSRNYFE